MASRLKATAKPFQSTLPVWGATVIMLRIHRLCSYFNPRSPCGERQAYGMDSSTAYQVSIHAPRVGSDLLCKALISCLNGFNPRSPCGERLSAATAIRLTFKFQSTLPVWGATL